MKDRCPLCSGTDLLIYGTHTIPQGCGVCFAKRNPDKWHEIKMQELEEFKKAINKLKTEMELKYGKSNRASKTSE